jgi:plastocyanin
MRRVLVLTVGAIAAVALMGGVAFAAKNPPVQLQGKVNNKGAKTVKKGKISIETDDYYFKPTFDKAKPGSTVTVSLKNEGKTQHTFTIPSLGIDTVLNPDQKATVSVTVPTDGALGFYCRFHGPSGTQGDLGMQGAFFTKKGQSVSAGGAGATPSSAATATTTAASSSSGMGGPGY